MREVIEEKLFEKAYIAWDYMVDMQKNDNEFIYCIPSSNMCLVKKYKKRFSELELRDLPKGIGVFMVSSDSMDSIHGIQSHADGKYYDSKSKYRASLKAQGYIEMGTDAPKERNNEVRGDFVSKKEIAEVVNRFS